MQQALEMIILKSMVSVRRLELYNDEDMSALRLVPAHYLLKEKHVMINA